MRQSSAGTRFLYLGNRLAELSAKQAGDLQRLKALVDFEMLRARARRGLAGR
jgi:hypothetical protein